MVVLSPSISFSHPTTWFQLGTLRGHILCYDSRQQTGRRACAFKLIGCRGLVEVWGEAKTPVE